ncbi:MAG: thioether cross-link-forming SCIFF peptide maturase [Lachnospiraceae bacterium]|nr:thioether cross-link-forming SCIFF peptide maturase [Lachnospiraceae bacterium]
MIHQYKNQGYNIVLDVNSGAVHLVDDLTYEVIDRLESGRKELGLVSFQNRAEAEGSALHTDDSEDIPAGDIHTEGIHTEDIHSEDIHSENIQAGDIRSENVHVENIPAEDDSLADQVFPAELSARILNELGSCFSAEEIKESLAECAQLTEDGALFSEDIYENAIIDYKARKTVVKALCLHIAHDCNLACRYCFAEEGEYHGRRALMSYEVGKKALDFLIVNSGSRRNLEVDFFGGEPLMNWQVVKDLVRYGREQEKIHNKNFRFTMTTNGVLLNDEIMEFLNQEMANVVLSIDGRPEVHDYMRPFRGGKGSYDLVMPKFRRFVELRRGAAPDGTRTWYVRGTFTHHNLDFCNDVLHLLDAGFDRISIEPVVADASEDYAIREEDLPQIFAEYDRLTDEMIRREKEGKGFTFFHFMLDLSGGPCVYKRLSGCGSGTEYLAVTPWGDLYPCHQFVGHEEYLMGNVDEGITRPEIVDEFKGCNVYTKKKCRNCFAKFYCSGGCAANSYNFHGTIQDAYDIGCELMRKRVECAIAIKAALAED